MEYQEPTIYQPPPPHTRGVSKIFGIGILAIGVLLGFTLGIVFSIERGRSGPATTSLFDEELVASLFESASPAVVEINIPRRIGQVVLPGTDTGSGFFIDNKGHIVTNHHVVDGATEISVKLFDGRVLQARQLGSSPADDLALLEVDPEDVKEIDSLPLADSTQVRPGEMAVAIGSPFRQFNSLTVGVVSGTGRGPASVLRRPIPDMIQTDATLNPGNSGGPLLSSRGEVMGVTSSVRTDLLRDLGEYRIGFAVPSNTIKDLLPKLLKSQEVRRPWLGISGVAVSPELTEAEGIPSGVYVTGVFGGSPAEDAGLLGFATLGGNGAGDVITAVDGEPVASMEDMVSHFNRLDPGASVTLSIFRSGRNDKVPVTLAEWPDG